MVVGMGVDVAAIPRVARLVADHDEDLDRIFTLPELQSCNRGAARRRSARYATAFAAKEAVMKAIGTGWRSDVQWNEIDTVTIDPRGGVTLCGGARRAAAAIGITRVLVSVAVTADLAIASAVAERALDV